MDRKFKHGDRVRVKQWDDMVVEFGLDGDGCIASEVGFTPGMRDLCGKTATVDECSGTHLDLCSEEGQGKFDWNWCFSADTFELAE
jgi:hypothetical protein